MVRKKIWLLISDGLGVRNFAYNGLNEFAEKEGIELTYWNNTIFRLSDLGLREVVIENPKNHPLTDVYKKTINKVELTQFERKTDNPVYNSYLFPFISKGYKSLLKEWMFRFLEKMNNSEDGLKKLRNKIKNIERKTSYYKYCLAQLKEGKPDLVFNSSQRHVTSLAPILAAQDLKIPTVTFIFSWDNLPKATLVVEADYYFVWSEYMKYELLFYHSFIHPDQVIVTGTTQFDWHVNPEFILPREEFFRRHKLDPQKKYICFSGDDVTTSPNDPSYLYDLAVTVKKLNNQGLNLGILFRRCPVDFSSRFDQVEKEFSDIIFPIRPRWKKMGKDWNFILPEREDLSLLANVCEHSETVINVGSSMVFDFFCHKKSCYFLNYDVDSPLQENWTIHKIYKFIHFESMPTQDCVGWVNSKSDFERIILSEISGESINLNSTAAWFEIINAQPLSDTNKRFFEAFSSILGNS